jgi:hypothetical protein
VLIIADKVDPRHTSYNLSGTGYTVWWGFPLSKKQSREYIIITTEKETELSDV